MENDSYFLNSKYQRIYYAQYKKQLIDEYNGNPLIEALPAILSREEAREKMCRYPKWDESERLLPIEIRRQSVLKITEYFQPWHLHFELEQSVSALIRRGYISRNPLSPEYALDNHSIYKAIRSKDCLTAPRQYQPSTATTLSILGASGVGKTTAIENVLSLYPQVICHQSYEGPPFNQYQVVWLKIECPFDGSLKNLCRRFFESMDNLLDENYSTKYGSDRTTTDAMIPHMEAIAHRHHLGVLVIDEIQILTEAKNINVNHMLNFFTSLVNTIKIPIVLIGTTDALDLLQRDFRHARRGTGHLGSINFDPLPRNAIWELLIEGLWEYQWTSENNPLTEELSELLHEESQGIVDIAVKLYAKTQVLAMENGTEVITPALMKRAAKETLRLVRGGLDLLKGIGSLEHQSKELLCTESKTKRISRIDELKQLNLPRIDPQKVVPGDPNDLRVIARRAQEEGHTVYEELKQCGVIRNPIENP